MEKPVSVDGPTSKRMLELNERERFLTEEWPAVAERIERLGLSIEDLLQSKGNK